MRSTAKASLATRTVCAVAFMLATAGSAFAVCADDSAIADPVNVTLHRCLKAPHTKTTIDIRECYSAADRAYSDHLKKTYASVLQHVDPKSRSLVRASQRSWLAYRDRMVAAQLGPWSDSRGTYIGIVTGKMNVEAVRQRLLELYSIWPGFAGENLSI